MANRIQLSLHAVSLATLISIAATGQQPTVAVQPSFDTASIRPSHLTPGCFSMLPPGGTHYELTCIQLRTLIGIAYKTNYIDGGGALDKSYDLRATTSNGELWTMDTVQPLLQQLLAERFHLVVHPGKREVSGYGLVVAKGGAKLHPTAPESIVQGQKMNEPSQNFTYPGHVQGRGLNPSGIASLLSIVMHAPVVDHTGLAGLFNIDLTYAPDTTTGSDLPSFFTAVEEQLGLKLKPEKVTVDTLVIDHVDDAPTPN